MTIRLFNWMLARLSVLMVPILVIISVSQITAVEFQKVDRSLSYWYRIYFDIGYLEKLADSLSKQQPVIHPDGSIDLPVSPDWISDYGNVSGSPIKLINGVPHVTASLGYNGDGADLNAIGVIYSVFAKESAIVVIPIENLPRLDSLPTVSRISSGQVDVVQTDDAEPITQQSIDTVCGDDMGTILVKCPTIKSDLWIEFILLEGKNAVSRLSGNWIYEYPVDESDNMEIVLSVPTSGPYQLIVKCAGDYSRTVCYSGIEVIQDSASLVSIAKGISVRDSTVKVQFQEWVGTRRAVNNSMTEIHSIGE